MNEKHSGELEEKRLTFWQGKDDRIISRLDNGKVVIVDMELRKEVDCGKPYECKVLEKEEYAIAYPTKRGIERRAIVREDNKVVYLDDIGEGELERDIKQNVAQLVNFLRNKDLVDESIELIVRERE